MNYTGNVDYKSIKDKQFLTADSENVSEIVKKLNEQNIQFSARYDDTKITVTFHKPDFDKVNAILNTVTDRSQEENAAENITPLTAAVNKLTADNEEVKPEHAALLPIINSKIVKHEQRIEDLKDRRAACENKISNFQDRAEKLNSKAERLMNTNQMLTELLASHKAPAVVVNSVRAVIGSNEKKISKIMNKQLPKLQSKIDKQMNAVEKINDLIDLRQCKIDRYKSLNSVIQSFAHGDRKQFSASLDELHNNTIKLLTAKINVKTDKIVNLTAAYQSSPVKSAVADIPRRLTRLKTSRHKLVEKRNKLKSVAVPYTSQPENVQDNVMKQTETLVTNAAKQENIEPAVFSEEAVFAPIPDIPVEYLEPPIMHPFFEEDMEDVIIPEIATVMEMPVSQIESKPPDLRESLILDYTNNYESTPEQIQESLVRLMDPDVRTEEKIEQRHEQAETAKTEGASPAAKKPDNPLKTAEELIEGNANMIDGIINNEPPKNPAPVQQPIQQPVQQPVKQESHEQEQPKKSFTFSRSQMKRNARIVSERKEPPDQQQNKRKPPDHGAL